MTCTEFSDLIDRYLKGDIPDDDEKKEAFEAHYFECDDCFSLLKVAERLKSKEVSIVLRGKRTFFLWKPALAFAVVLLVFISTFLVIDHSNGIKKMYRVSAFEAPAYIESEMRSGAGVDEVFPRAMEFYRFRHYSRALELLKQVPDSMRNPRVIFFKGMCNLLLDKKEEAIKEFDFIIGDMNPSYYDEATYYKAIALIRLNKKDQAVEILENLSRMFSPYSPKAKAMIENLRH